MIKLKFGEMNFIYFVIKKEIERERGGWGRREGGGSGG